MTNGEMIQKVFNCEVCEPIFENDIIHVIFADKKDSAIGFDWSWWSAEYKEPTTKNDLGVLDKISAEIAEYGSIWVEYKITGNSNRDIEKLVGDVLSQAKKQVLDVIDKYKAESEG